MAERIDPGPGYRLLEVGEVIRKGDEVWEPNRIPPGWEACSLAIGCKHDNFTRRRKLTRLPRAEAEKVANAICNEIDNRFASTRDIWQIIVKHLAEPVKLEWEFDGTRWTSTCGKYQIRMSSDGCFCGGLLDNGMFEARFRATGNLDEAKAAAQRHADKGN